MHYKVRSARQLLMGVFHRGFHLHVPMRAGELPLSIGRLKDVNLRGNQGFTLSSNIGELSGDITKLDLSNCSLAGPRSTRSERLHMLLTFMFCCYRTPAS